MSRWSAPLAVVGTMAALALPAGAASPPASKTLSASRAQNANNRYTKGECDKDQTCLEWWSKKCHRASSKVFFCGSRNRFANYGQTTYDCTWVNRWALASNKSVDYGLKHKVIGYDCVDNG